MSQPEQSEKESDDPLVKIEKQLASIRSMTALVMGLVMIMILLLACWVFELI